MQSHNLQETNEVKVQQTQNKSQNIILSFVINDPGPR